MNHRIKYIDIARALAIIFIVLGHTVVHSVHCSEIFKFLYGFHVILFFILSGYTFRIKDNETFLNFFKSKFFRIMLPYFIWAFLFLIPYMLFGQNVGGALGILSDFDLKKQMVNILYGIGVNNLLKQNSSLWFLPALFSMEILYSFFIKYLKNKKIGLIVSLSLSLVVSYISVYLLDIHLPWGLNTSLNLGIFFLLGNYLKESDIQKISHWPFLLLLFVLGFLSCFFNKTVSYIEYEYGNFTLAFISGICLSLFIIGISKIIKCNNFLEYIGKNTMGILIFHKLIILIFQTKLGIFSDLLNNSNFYLELLLAVMVTFISIAFSIIISDFIRKLFPFLIGERKK